MNRSDDLGSISIRSERDWVGNGKMGAFSVSVDGRGVGLLMPRRTLTVSVIAGRHEVRARQWWFRSERVTVEVAAGGKAELVARTQLDGGVLSRMWVYLVRPFSALVLELASADPPLGRHS